VGLASQLSNKEENRRPPTTSQLAVLLLLKKKPVDSLDVKEPEKKTLYLPSRIAFAEYHAREGRYKEAFDIATYPGTPAEQVEACVGVAQVILSRGKDADMDEAGRFVEAALVTIKEKQPKLSPWVTLQ